MDDLGELHTSTRYHIMRKESANQALRKKHEAVGLLLVQDPSWDFLRRAILESF